MPLVVLLAGARETAAAASWLRAAGCRACALWAQGAVPVALDIPAVAAMPDDVAGVVDASHAFDTASRACVTGDMPYARVGRDPWMPQPGDSWTEVDDIDAAVAALPSGARVFAATGRASLPSLAAHDGPVFLRQLTRHDQPTGFDTCTYVFGTAPFSVADEVALLQELKIHVVLARNIGGAGSFPKLAAARELGLPVVLVRPPALPQGPRLHNLEDVVGWVQSL
ncbi:precorrin-6A/cobalt-precorrin-6A reductase [uncultured Tateyamaria sp.]|uniref:precorrin-6A/cobalt-precorrin-6A reductase n=1 Tax=uncultured Tateyamaria sp. TaxID=455651 RepID=UPI0026185C77|nr:precorrin-6A/cobalt-precorrin-6A reductase [uncultured Tateyamaria sp.]